MRGRLALAFGWVSLAALACSAEGSKPVTHEDAGGGGHTLDSSVSVATGSGGALFPDGGPNGGAGGSMSCTPGGPDDDRDHDGFTPAQGDCDDCDPNVNPGAVEVATPANGVAKDENCNGVVDEVDPGCDADLALDDADPLKAAAALELCKVSKGAGDWGVVSARWVLPDSSPPTAEQDVKGSSFHLGHGILSHLGANVATRRGDRMLAISSGAARNPDEPGFHSLANFDKHYTSGLPDGFSADPGCGPGVPAKIHDGVALEVTLRTPSNAQGLSFDFNFFTYEWPEYVCDKYNDYFAAMLTTPGFAPANVSFDGQLQPVSVNDAFLQVCGCAGNPPGVCSAGVTTKKTFACPLGDTQLVGTGFGFDTEGKDHGATGWLRTTAPVAPNTQIVLLWTVFDSADGLLDTTVLLDDFQWTATPGSGSTLPVPR